MFLQPLVVIAEEWLTPELISQEVLGLWQYDGGGIVLVER